MDRRPGIFFSLIIRESDRLPIFWRRGGGEGAERGWMGNTYSPLFPVLSLVYVHFLVTLIRLK